MTEDDNDDLYAIVAVESRRVKIGRAGDPLKRLGDLQVGNHEELRILSTFRGAGSRENEAHKQFADWSVRGEWFSSEVTDLIEVSGLECVLNKQLCPDDRSKDAKAALDRARVKAYDCGYCRGRRTRIREIADELAVYAEEFMLSPEAQARLTFSFNLEKLTGETTESWQRHEQIVDEGWAEFQAGPLWNDYLRGCGDGYQTILDTKVTGRRSRTIGEEIRRQADAVEIAKHTLKILKDVQS